MPSLAHVKLLHSNAGRCRAFPKEYHCENLILPTIEILLHCGIGRHVSC